MTPDHPPIGLGQSSTYATLAPGARHNAVPVEKAGRPLRHRFCLVKSRRPADPDKTPPARARVPTPSTEKTRTLSWP